MGTVVGSAFRLPGGFDSDCSFVAVQLNQLAVGQHPMNKPHVVVVLLSAMPVPGRPGIGSRDLTALGQN